MKRLALMALGILAAGTVLPMAGCAEQVAHTETDKPRLLGGRTHEETTVWKNPDGTLTTEHSKMKTP